MHALADLVEHRYRGWSISAIRVVVESRGKSLGQEIRFNETESVERFDDRQRHGEMRTAALQQIDKMPA
jgi:hypothetical protein